MYTYGVFEFVHWHHAHIFNTAFKIYIQVHSCSECTHVNPVFSLFLYIFLLLQSNPKKKKKYCTIPPVSVYVCICVFESDRWDLRIVLRVDEARWCWFLKPSGFFCVFIFMYTFICTFICMYIFISMCVCVWVAVYIFRGSFVGSPRVTYEDLLFMHNVLEQAEYVGSLYTHPVNFNVYFIVILCIWFYLFLLWNF